MQLQKVSRSKAKIKMALQGPAGSGKTYSALLLAYGLCQDWNKIAVIDTENSSANLYAHLGSYNTLSIVPPFSPEKYIQAIKACEDYGISVIILDSASHEWEGPGGILDIHSGMVGNSFTNWAKVTPRHNQFVQTMLHCNCHVIATIRSKQDYVINEKNGKMVPEKVGLKGVQREGLDYEFTIVFDIDIKHNATASKDRTFLFADKPEFKISPETGKRILEWCNEGNDIITPVISNITTVVIPENELLSKIESCGTIQQLLDLFNANPIYQETHLEYFTQKRQELVASDNSSIASHLKVSANGTH